MLRNRNVKMMKMRGSSPRAIILLLLTTSSSISSLASPKNVLLTERNVRASSSSDPPPTTTTVRILEDGTTAVLSTEGEGKRGLFGFRRGGRSIRAAMRKTFLPTGFPESVPAEYLQFQKFHVLQDLATQVRTALATSRVLTGLGVGSAEATAASAITSWLLRDGAGMVSSLFFTGLNSDVFGADVRRWRFFADAIVDVGILCEMCAGSFFAIGGGGATGRTYPLFLGLLCLGSVCKALCGVAAGSANSAISLYFANSNSNSNSNSGSIKGGDIAEIAAKGGAIGTISGLLGLVLSLGLARLTAPVPVSASSLSSSSRALTSAWTWFWCLTGLHLWSCRCGLRLLALRTITMPRLALLLDHFHDTAPTLAPTAAAPAAAAAAAAAAAPVGGVVASPAELAKSERVVAFPSSFSRVRMGVSLGHLAGHLERAERRRKPPSPPPPPPPLSSSSSSSSSSASSSAVDLAPSSPPSSSADEAGLRVFPEGLVQRFRDEPFLPIAVRQGRGSRWEVLVLLKEGAGDAEELRAAAFALLLLRRLDAAEATTVRGARGDGRRAGEEGPSPPPDDDEAAAAAATATLKAAATAGELLADFDGRFFPAFRRALKSSGWGSEAGTSTTNYDLRLLSAPWRVCVEAPAAAATTPSFPGPPTAQ